MRTSLKGKKILVVDDDELFCDGLADYLGDKGLKVRIAHTGQKALEIASADRFDVALLDQKLPDANGQDLCPSLLKTNERLKIIFITAHASFDGAVEAIRAGAHDYLSKPVELEELYLAIKQALRLLALEKVDEVERYRRDKESQEAILVGTDGGLAEVERLIGLAAASEAPVLVTGETGTGKNVVAKNIHYRSAKRDGAFIAINCAALPENLIEAELFGNEKGAFTGADAARRGVFEMAEGGTLFLDEIGEMPLHLQTKLLTVLEDKQVKRLGGELIRPVDVRVIAATAADLSTALGKTFREDLYFRLSVVRIHLPPLRERFADLPALCDHLLGQTSGGRRFELSEQELARLEAYEWPGNVRELKNVLERASLLQPGPVIEPSRLMGDGLAAKQPGRQGGFAPPQDPPPGVSAEPDARQGPIRPLKDIEQDYVLYALKQHNDNYTQTAKALGIALSTLKRKLAGYGLR